MCILSREVQIMTSIIKSEIVESIKIFADHAKTELLSSPVGRGMLVLTFVFQTCKMRNVYSRNVQVY